MSWLFQWLPDVSRWLQPWLESRYPALWFWLLARSYALTYGVGHPQAVRGKAGAIAEPAQTSLSRIGD
jgi:lycopene cyclase CruA